ncbi:MAG: potassium-transporting ATPase subunit KdpA [bacterium]
MDTTGILQIVIVLSAIILTAVPLSRYMAHIFNGESTFLDKLVNPLENLTFKFLKVNEKEGTGWLTYLKIGLIINFFMLALVFIILRFQNYLPFNQMHYKGIPWALDLNTVISFITNTNWQNYGGESTLSNFSQMALVFLQFTSAATGLVFLIAFIRGLVKTQAKNVGNFYSDFIKTIYRVFIPLAVVFAVIMLFLGSPQTFKMQKEVVNMTGAKQFLSVGPVASMVSIENLGTNGGGFYNANAAQPYENPTPLANALIIFMMSIIPVAIFFMYGIMIRNKKHALTLFLVALTLLAVCVFTIYRQEAAGNPFLAKLGADIKVSKYNPGGNMTGKEEHIGIAQSSLFAAATTAFTTGNVDSAHDSYMPLSVMVLLGEMMLNLIFGGKGVGLLNMLTMVIIGVFIAGLMVGRTPEFLGKKIEAKEVKLATLAMFAHAFIIIVPLTVALSIPAGLAGAFNPGPHGFSEILYAFTSTVANNGSAMAGFNGTSTFYNVILGMTIFFGRYIPIICQVAIAGSLIKKKSVPESLGTFPAYGMLFYSVVMGTIILIGALTFFPALALGPIAEHFALVQGHLFK